MIGIGIFFCFKLKLTAQMPNILAFFHRMGKVNSINGYIEKGVVFVYISGTP